MRYQKLNSGKFCFPVSKNFVLPLTIIAMVFVQIFVAKPSIAADPQVARPQEQGGVRDSQSSQPVIEVNRAEDLDSQERESVQPEKIYSSPEATSESKGRSLNPMMTEIKELIEQGRLQSLELESRIALAIDEETVLTLQREIENLAQETELDILRIQVRHARLAGRDQIADKLESDIAEIQSPTVSRVQIDRPVPTNQ